MTTMNFTEMLKDAMELGLTKEEAMSFVKDCLALTQTAAPTTVGGNTAKKPTGAKAPTKTKAQPKAEATKFSTDLKDYQPKAEGGNYNWKSYKAQRTHYCYAVATDGHCDSNPHGSKWAEAGNVVDYSPNGKYYTAKAQFEATYKYITKANR